MKKISITKFANMVLALKNGETITFYNGRDDEGENAFGVAKLYSFDSHLILLNYWGGDFPRVIDLTRAIERDLNEKEVLKAALGEYVYDVVISKPRDCVYLKDYAELTADIKGEDTEKCVCGESLMLPPNKIGDKVWIHNCKDVFQYQISGFGWDGERWSIVVDKDWFDEWYSTREEAERAVEGFGAVPEGGGAGE